MPRPPGVQRRTPQQVAAQGHFGEELPLALEKAELFSARAFVNPHLVGHEGLDGILGKSAQRGAGEAQAGIVRHLQAGDQAETLRVALKAGQVFLLALAQLRAGVLPHLRGFEPNPDGILAGMSERRISQVVGQGRRGNDGAEIRRVEAGQFAALADRGADDGSERARHTRHLEAMREPGAHVIVVGQRKNLRLVLQTAERGRENDAVPVALKRRALRLRSGRSFAAETISAQEFGPLHHHGCFAAVR